MSNYTKIDAYLESHLDESIAELSQLVAQPSVGAQNLGMKECAALVAGMLRKRGFTAEIMPTGNKFSEGAPVVLGERKGKSDKTLLFYNHYDVQPPEPLELWETPPFEPSLREGKLFGRGVSDDKGHILARLFAIDALLNELSELPCNVKFIIEGEEEVGSSSLASFLKERRAELSCDGIVISDTGMPTPKHPALTYALRGIAGFEVTLRGPARDLPEDRHGLGRRNPLPLVDQVPEVLPLDVLHGDVGVVAADAVVVHPRDVRVLDLPVELDLPLEPQEQRLLVALDARLEDLDGHDLVQLGVHRLEDGSDAPLPERREPPVAWSPLEEELQETVVIHVASNRRLA